MEAIELVDAKTGRLLHIEFDIDADRMTIDGVEVERKRPLESNEDEFVYAPPGPGPWKLVHLTAEQVGRIRALWESRLRR